ncbi:MAG: hypothetical protein WC699_05760 [Bacteroidales bacterium]|jgi:hypothetical protein
MKITSDAKPVSDALREAAEYAGSFLGDAIDSFGCTIFDSLVRTGRQIHAKPVFTWLGGLLKAPFSLTGAIIKGLFGIVGGMLGGMIKIIAGIITLSSLKVVNGIWDIGSPVFGAIIVVAGKIAGWVQSIFYLQEFERPLTDHEKLELNRVFKDSLNYYVIRIVEGHSGLFGINRRPFTLGNTIYVKKWKNTVDLTVHETTHVWQNRHRGNRYTSDAIVAQWFVKDAYNWQKELSGRKKEHWVDFNMEAQAAFIEDLWMHGNPTFFSACGKKQSGHFEMSGTDYTNIANEVVSIISRPLFIFL